MSIFDEVLKSNESIFKNDVALSYEFMPKFVPYREGEQRVIASGVAPLFHNRTGRNIIIHGPPGVGKTVATRHVLAELEKKSADIIPYYINCWQKNTTYKIMLGLCDLLDYRFTHNKKTDELFSVIKSKLQRQAVVFIFDEIDKAEDTDFLYWILSDILQKSVICITNFPQSIAEMDMRVKSRLTPELIEFKPYNQKEIQGILQQRVQLAFYDKVWEPEALQEIFSITTTLKDVRTGLYLLKEAGLAAEEKASKKVTLQHTQSALKKLNEFKIKDTQTLDNDIQDILEVTKGAVDKRIGELFETYTQKGGKASYKTFQRRIQKLAEGKFINVKKVQGGIEGTSTLVTYNTTLLDFS
ncbi:MAG: Cdc6/Cdc18 family protein [Candidatus Woesearchaeota archaeon]